MLLLETLLRSMVYYRAFVSSDGMGDANVLHIKSKIIRNGYLIQL